MYRCNLISMCVSPRLASVQGFSKEVMMLWWQKSGMLSGRSTSVCFILPRRFMENGGVATKEVFNRNLLISSLKMMQLFLFLFLFRGNHLLSVSISDVLYCLLCSQWIKRLHNCYCKCIYLLHTIWFKDRETENF